jgi:hypothetical protein
MIYRRAPRRTRLVASRSMPMLGDQDFLAQDVALDFGADVEGLIPPPFLKTALQLPYSDNRDQKRDPTGHIPRFDFTLPRVLGFELGAAVFDCVV